MLERIKTEAYYYGNTFAGIYDLHKNIAGTQHLEILNRFSQNSIYMMLEFWKGMRAEDETEFDRLKIIGVVWKNMTEKDLKRLNRRELLELLLEKSYEIEKLQKNVEKLQSELDDRRIMIEEAGSLAEATLMINGVIKDAQMAADQYLENVKQIAEQKLRESRKIEQEAKTKAEQLLLETREQCAEMTKQAREQCDAMCRLAKADPGENEL